MVQCEQSLLTVDMIEFLKIKQVKCKIYGYTIWNFTQI